MTPIAGRPVLSQSAMRAAENRAIKDGVSVTELMERAGVGVAQATARLAAGASVLVLCGPGNNGGDGYVAARWLATHGHDVRVAATSDPTSDAAKAARRAWGGGVDSLETVAGAPVVVDAVFGTGLSRPLDSAIAGPFETLVKQASLAIAVDLPSGIATDDGAVLGTVASYDVTLALGALKPSHLLQPAARYCGAVRVIDFGIAISSDWHVLDTPRLVPPGPDAHKYNRGMVAVVGGAMAGAQLLAATAAMRAGAGYVEVLGGAGDGPQALVHREFDDAALNDDRIGALLIGPGLGRDATARERLDRMLATARALVIDGDALHLVADRVEQLAERQESVILTPHAGEFAAVFGNEDGSKVDRALAAARRSGAVVVFKGPDTVIAAPDGRGTLCPDANDWLSTAGTGDVLAGTIAAIRAGGFDAFAAANAGVWLHAEAARRLGGAFIADDLANEMSAARASL